MLSNMQPQSTATPLDRTPFLVACAWLLPACTFAMLIGMYGAALGWRPAAFVMLAGALGRGSLDLVAGITLYRKTMARPWPRVAPLADDDDW
jgi:hypothetical protein